MYVRTYVYMYVFMYVCVCMYVCVRVYVYIGIYILFKEIFKHSISVALAIGWSENEEMYRTRTEAAAVLFETGKHPAFAWRDSPCLGDFKTLDISDVKTVTNFILLAAKFGNELR